jgi:hypothetical protein
VVLPGYSACLRGIGVIPCDGSISHATMTVVRMYGIFLPGRHVLTPITVFGDQAGDGIRTGRAIPNTGDTERSVRDRWQHVGDPLSVFLKDAHADGPAATPAPIDIGRSSGIRRCVPMTQTVGIAQDMLPDTGRHHDARFRYRSHAIPLCNQRSMRILGMQGGVPRLAVVNDARSPRSAHGPPSDAHRVVQPTRRTSVVIQAGEERGDWSLAPLLTSLIPWVGDAARCRPGNLHPTTVRRLWLADPDRTWNVTETMLGPNHPTVQQHAIVAMHAGWERWGPWNGDTTIVPCALILNDQEPTVVGVGRAMTVAGR